MTRSISLFQNKFSGENLFFTSDTHFFHEGIIKFCNRPFESVEEMNETAYNRLYGKIYLILGNHDLKNAKQGFMDRFEHVSQQMSISVDGQKIILNHNPFLCYGGAYDGAWQLFGHVHSGPRSKTGKDIPRLSMLFPTQYDVGVDNNGFKPVSFYELKTIIQNQQEK